MGFVPLGCANNSKSKKEDFKSMVGRQNEKKTTLCGERGNGAGREEVGIGLEEKEVVFRREVKKGLKWEIRS